jgi:RNA polymerase sigma factor (sigma-70 family)
MPYAQQQQESVLRGPGVPDGVLIGQALAGDQSAFACLLNRYRHPLASYIGSILKDRDQVYDVLQHVFIQLYVSLPILSTHAPLKGWLFRVARNRCLDELCKRNRRAEVPFSTFEWEDREEGMSPVEEIPDTEPLPEEVAERIDLYCSLWQSIVSLPPKFRRVVHLHCFRQLSFSEIGRMLEMSEPTVKACFYRSLPLFGEHSRAICISYPFRSVKPVRRFYGPANASLHSALT